MIKVEVCQKGDLKMLATIFGPKLDKIEEPARRLLETFDRDVRGFYNFIIYGPRSRREKCRLNAFCIIGLAPGSETFVTYHACSGRKELDGHGELLEARSLAFLKKITLEYTLPLEWEAGDAILFLDPVRQTLGEGYQVIGAVTTHQILSTKEDFVILWTNPKIRRPISDYIVREVIKKRL